MKICFICLGNICRSTMAEYIFKSMVKDSSVEIFSRGISNEEYSHDIYPPAKRMLDYNHIPYTRHFAKKITKDEVESCDYIFVAEYYQIERVKRIGCNNNVYLMTEYIDKKDIDDPWYTGNFGDVYQQIYEGLLEIKEALELE